MALLDLVRIVVTWEFIFFFFGTRRPRWWGAVIGVTAVVHAAGLMLPGLSTRVLVGVVAGASLLGALAYFGWHAIRGDRSARLVAWVLISSALLSLLVLRPFGAPSSGGQLLHS